MSALFAEEEHHPDLMLGDLEKVVTQYSRGFERSLQRSIGPSEVGNSCERRVAMTLLGTEPSNADRDEWTSSVGTAVHTWMEGAFREDNRRRLEAGKPARWLVEETVEIRTGMVGHTDVVDLETMTVLDHKFPGVTAIRKYRKARHPITQQQGYPGDQYRTQAHLYGMGWAKLGLPIRQVAIAMYPRSGLIRDSWLWREDYDESVAEAGLARLDALTIGMNMAENSDTLAGFMDSLGRDTTHCSWCGYFDRTATDPTTACKGPFYDPEHSDPNTMSVPGIIA